MTEYAQTDILTFKEELIGIQAAIATLKEKLPFLLSLTPEESKTLLRLGDIALRTHVRT